MKEIEKSIKQLVKSQFPSFYRDEGKNFIAFVSAYYEWLETLVMVLNLDNATGFDVGNTVTQYNSEGEASGEIIYKSGNTVYVVNNSDVIFRCRLYCDEIKPIESSSGSVTYINTTSSPNSLYHSRNLLNYKDIDTTIAKFIVHFKEKYLNNIQFTTSSNKKLLLKKAQDLYRSKGTPRAVELFFRLVYGDQAEIYVPGQDILRPSDGQWVKPVYIEVSREDININFVGKQITGITSGATAFVDRLIRRRVKSKYVDIFYLSNITKSFTTGEFITYADSSHSQSDLDVTNYPTVVGSLTSLTVLSSGTGYKVGDIVDVYSSFGQQGQARVGAVKNIAGVVDFALQDGGFGFSTNSTVYVSEKILSLSNVTVTNTSLSRPFLPFEQVTQQVANIAVQGVLLLTLQSNTGAFTTNENVYQAVSGANVFIGKVHASNSTTLTIKYPNTGTFSTALSLTGATSGSLATISAAAVDSSAPVGSNVTSYYSNGVVAGRGVVDTFYTNSTPYAYVIRVVPTSGNLYDSSNTNYSNFLFVGSTSAPNTYRYTTNSYSNVSATAIVTGVSNTVVLYTTDLSGALRQFETVTQGTTANGVVTLITNDGSNAYITVSNTNGIFATSTRITGSSSGSSANVRAFSTTIGVHSVNNKFTNTNLQTVTGAYSTTGKLTIISQGSGADFNIGSLDNEEQISLGTDFLSQNNTSNVPYTSVRLNATAYGFPKFPTGNVSSGLLDCLTFFVGNLGSVASLTNINPGSNYDLDPFVLVYEPASIGFNKVDVRISYTQTSTASFANGEIITQEQPVANSTSLTVGAASAGFTPGLYVYQSNGSVTTATGYIQSVNITANAGTIVVRNVSGTFNSTAGFFQKVRAQANSTLLANANITGTAPLTTGLFCKGQIRTVNSTSMDVKYLTIQSSFGIGNPIVGQSTAATGTINAVAPITSSLPAGLNAQIFANVITSSGAVTELLVTDSGFGYVDGEVIEYSSNAESKTTGLASSKLGLGGTGSGYYESTRGFLSSDKYLLDSDYYQEFSYEILSRLPFSTYEKIFKEVMHIAGTKLFGSVVLASNSSVNITPL